MSLLSRECRALYPYPPTHGNDRHQVLASLHKTADTPRPHPTARCRRVREFSLMPHPSQRLSTRALNPAILPILKHLKLSSLLLLSISITIPIRLYSPKPNLTSPPRFVTEQRPPGGKVYYLPPGLDHKNFSPRTRWRTYVPPRFSELESRLC